MLDDGADPEIADSNVMVDNTEDRVSYGLSLAAPPPPVLPPPPPPPPMPSVD